MNSRKRGGMTFIIYIFFTNIWWKLTQYASIDKVVVDVLAVVVLVDEVAIAETKYKQDWFKPADLNVGHCQGDLF